ncbi:MAG: NAD-dependent epimerase/dehydratase family protein [Planctomycetes bacterium]|nr:NAD-dependent epimerase/dehydratase family protein [Planctomycetota bacterium]
MRVLVTGATGFIGHHVAAALIAEGHDVRCLARSGSRRPGLPDGSAWIEGDLRSRQDLEGAVGGCEAVVHAAAHYALWARDPREFYEVNVEGTRRLLSTARAAGVRRVVYTSSVSCVGEAAPGRLADEDTPVRPNDLVGDYKRSKWEAEQVALSFARSGARDALEVVAVLPASTIGPGDARPTPTGEIIRDFLAGKMPRVIDTPMSFVDVRDVAAGHVLALHRGRSGRRYILTSREGNVGLATFLALVAEVAGVAPPRGGVPYWLAWLAGAASTFVADRVTHRPPRVPLAGVRMASHRMQFDPGRAIRELGLPQTPLRDTVRDAVAWFRGARPVSVGAALPYPSPPARRSA